MSAEIENLCRDPRIVLPGETELMDKVAEWVYGDAKCDTPPASLLLREVVRLRGVLTDIAESRGGAQDWTRLRDYARDALAAVVIPEEEK